MDKIIRILFILNGQHVEVQAHTSDLFAEVAFNYLNKIGKTYENCKFFFKGRELLLSSAKTLDEYKIFNNEKIDVVLSADIIGAGPAPLIKEINIKFIKISKNIVNNFCEVNLKGLLKLCLLKEIAPKLSNEQIYKFPDKIFFIMNILKKGRVLPKTIEQEIIKILQKMDGSNILCFSDYVNEEINSKQVDEMINLLNPNDIKEIKNIKFLLSKYNDHIKLFDKEFEKAKRESIFEFSIISLVIIEREDFEKFEQERKKCPNRVEKILFHGTSIEPISCILTGLFKKSVDRHYQHGKGVYFTDFLDYCWFYGGNEGNRANKNKIPKVEDNFTLIACSIYYNQEGYRKVKDYKYDPKKNEINFAYAGAHFET